MYVTSPLCFTLQVISWVSQDILGSYLQDPYVSIQNIYAPVDLVSDITLAASVRGQCIVHIVFHLTQTIKISATAICYRLRLTILHN